MLCEVPQKRLPWRGLLLCERPPPRAARSVGPCFETGWTPQPPRWGFVIKRFLGFCGSRSWRGWSWAEKSEPKRKNEQRLSPPFWGARRPDAGVRPSTQCEKGGRRTIHTPSLTREPGAPRTKLGSVLLPSASEAGGSKTAAARLLKRSLSTREALPRHGSWRSCGGRSFANQKRAPPRKTHPRRKIQPPLPENLFEQQTSSSGVQP